MGCVPWVTSLARIAYNEGGLMLFGVLAVGWVMVTRDWPGWMLAGGMAGLACGVKLTAGPMVVIGGVVAALFVYVISQKSKVKSGEGINVISGVAIYVVMALVVFAPWLIRN